MEIENPADCGRLLKSLVKSELAAWRSGPRLGGERSPDDAAPAETGFSGPKSETEINSGALEGKIKFGRSYCQDLSTENEALAAAESAFSNGLIRLFINDEEVKSINAALSLQDDDQVTLIALRGLGNGNFRF
jgi:hypothetical protein